MNTNAPGASLADVKQLIYFQIYNTNPNEQFGTVALFSNGNQYCRIRVGVIAADATGTPVNLSIGELRAAVSLIFYDDPRPLGDGYATSPDWEGGRFEWDETAIPVSYAQTESARRRSKAAPPAHAGISPAAAQVLEFYVCAAPGSVSRMLAAQFKGINGLLVTTSPTVADSNGPGRDGQFDSGVEVLLAKPPTLSAADYGAVNGVIHGTKVGRDDYYYKTFEYYLDPKLNGLALPLRSIGANASVGGDPPAGAFGFYTHGSFSATVRWGISYYGQPGSTDYESAALPVYPLYLLFQEPIASDFRGEHEPSQRPDSPHLMFFTCIGKLVGANRTRVVIGILKGTLNRLFRSLQGSPVTDVNSTTMHILDAYGNSHSLTLSYNATADELRIA
jgi:hypothetical protein